MLKDEPMFLLTGHDMSVSCNNQYQVSRYDGSMVPGPGPMAGLDTFDYGLNLDDVCWGILLSRHGVHS